METLDAESLEGSWQEPRVWGEEGGQKWLPPGTGCTGSSLLAVGSLTNPSVSI